MVEAQLVFTFSVPWWWGSKQPRVRAVSDLTFSKFACLSVHADRSTKVLEFSANAPL